MELDAAHPSCAQRLDDRRRRLLACLRVPVDRDRPHERGPRLEIEGRDGVLLAEVEVDGPVVDGRVRALALCRPEHRARLLVDDHERLGVTRAQRDASRRRVAPAPDVPGRRALELGEERGALERLRPERQRVGRGVSGPS